MDIKMILADLDGTLLNDEKVMTAYTRDTLALAAERGVWIVPATGRFFMALPENLRELPFLRYHILINGALVYDRAEDRALRRANLPTALADRLFARLRELPVTIDCYMEDDKGYMEAEHYERLDELVADLPSRELVRRLRRPIKDLRRYAWERGVGVQKIQSFFRDEALRQETMARFEADFPDISVACALPANMELNHRDATKGKALEFLCAHLGIPRGQVMAFGDERNDCSMLTYAGVGVAMGNAGAEARACADLTTESNREDGVARAIRRLVLHSPE